MTALTVRPAVKGVTIRSGAVLLLHHRYRGNDIYELPGGGQHFGETLHQALRREVLEETGVVIEPGPLLWARDYIGANHEYAHLKGQQRLHQVELVFACHPTADPTVEPSVPDTHQVGTLWATAAELNDLPLRPAAFVPMIERAIYGTLDIAVRYLGDAN